MVFDRKVFEIDTARKSKSGTRSAKNFVTPKSFRSSEADIVTPRTPESDRSNRKLMPVEIE